MQRNLINIYTLAAFGMLLLTMLSCKRYVDPPPYFEEMGDTTKPVTRKVLLIGIDGAVGSEYKTIAPPVLMGMKTHSKYSWDALSDASTTDASSWKTLTTGISYSNHQISDSTFIYTQGAGADEHGVIANYPSLFSYIISSARSNLHTSFISQWKTMLNSLVPEVEDRVLATSDGAVKDSALLRVKNEKSDVIFVHFNGVAVAGMQNGFSAAVQGYKDAVLKIDGYVGEIMTALKARPGYNKSEQWLVIVTGTHGGGGTAYGGSTPAETNVPSFYYMEDFKGLEFQKPSFSGIQFKGRDAAAVKATLSTDGALYDIGTGQQTIQLKIKGPNPGYYPHFFTRSNTPPFTGPGWTMFASGTNWAFSIKSAAGTERRIQTASAVFDDQWHTLTVVIYDSSSGKWVKRFVDGKRIIEDASNEPKRNLGATYGTIQTTAPMFLGWGGDKGYGAVTFYASDVMIFNTALTDDEVKNNVCLQDIAQHPKYANLIGYWPLNEGGFGNIGKNLAPGTNRPDFVLSGPYQWSGADAPCSVPAPPAGTTQMLMKSIDVVPNLFYWLRIPTATNWKLEGTKWIERYEIEFVKL